MSQSLPFSGNQFHSALDRIRKLLTSIEKESEDIKLHFQELEKARTQVRGATDNIPNVALINELPAEILSRVFGFVIENGSCLVQRDENGQILYSERVNYPLHPDALTCVCSYWRQVAISSPWLWTHIDIQLDNLLNPDPFTHAKVYATRAGQLPLHIHISDHLPRKNHKRSSTSQGGTSGPRHRSDEVSLYSDNLRDLKILASNSVAIKALEVDLCKPGVLNQYTTRIVRDGWGSNFRAFIEPVDKPHTLGGALIGVPSYRLEELWQGIAVVRVNDLCPHWGSTMYHGLVELDINSGVPNISESQLVTILKSSPKLQAFHIRTAIQTEELHVEPIYLEDLVDLKIMIRDDDDSGPQVLQWITPGPKPLQMAYLGPPFPYVEVPDFFSRANVMQFYLTHWDPVFITPIFERCSQIETLVLDGNDFDIRDLSSLLGTDGSDDSDSDQDSEMMSLPTARITTLYLLCYSRFSFEEIQAAVDTYSVRRLLIYGGKLSYQTDEGRLICDNTRNIRTKLASITACSSIEYYPDSNLIYHDYNDWIVASFKYCRSRFNFN